MNTRTTNLLLLALLLTFCFFGTDCKKEPVAPTQPTNPLQLSVEDVSCTEVWLKLSLAENEPSRTLTLQRGDSTIATITMAGQDSLLLDTLLLPNKTYTYTLVKPANNLSASGGNTQEWYATAQATTMNTTSQNWEWTVERIGVTATWLYDVAIVNDILAYAVGEIDNGDTGTGEKLYNIAKWDGKMWELIRLNYGGSFGGAIQSVFVINDSDVWFNPWFHWDGRVFQELSIDPIFMSVRINKMWGNAEALWVVGNNGFTGEGVIVRRNPNGKWQKIVSHTTATLFDMWGGNPKGSGNKWLSENVVLIAGRYMPSLKPILLQIKNYSEVDSLPLPAGYERMGNLVSTWFNENSPVYISGAPAFKFTSFTGWREDRLTPLFGTRRLRGNNMNDIISVGYPSIAHFNGVSWKVFDEGDLSSYYFGSVAIKGNLAIAVGQTMSSFSVGIVAVGRRK